MEKQQGLRCGEVNPNQVLGGTLGQRPNAEGNWMGAGNRGAKEARKGSETGARDRQRNVFKSRKAMMMMFKATKKGQRETLVFIKKTARRHKRSGGEKR